MELNYRLPTPSLRSLTTVLGDVAAGGAVVRDVVPAMLPNIHVRLAGRSWYRFADGTVVESPEVALLGPSNACFEITMSNDFEMVFAGLLPLGWRTLVPVAGHELTGRIVDAALVWPASTIARLLSRCRSVPGAPHRLAVVEDFLIDRRLERSSPPCPHLPAIDRWIEHSADLSLDALRRELAVSNRQMRRLTLDLHGLAPKTLAMKYRALRAAASLSIHGAPALRQAADLYADQSHLIRDFHRFVGWTPCAFVAQDRNLAAATLAGRWKAGATRPLSLLG